MAISVILHVGWYTEWISITDYSVDNWFNPSIIG